MARYVVKVKRTIRGREAESVLCSPRSKEEAREFLERLKMDYQSDQYYLERWTK